MKKKIILTCGQHMLTFACLKKLRNIFDLEELPCSVDEDGLISFIGSSVMGIIMGGFETITLKVLEKLAENASGNYKDIVIVFLGIQYETFFTPDALAYCRERGIVIRTTGEGSDAVAKMTARVIENWNPVECQISLSKKGQYVPPVHEITNSQKVLVVGVGNIGTEVAKSLKGRFLEVRYWAREKKSHMDKTGAVFYGDLEEAFSGTDVATIHLSLNEETKGIIGYEHLSLMNDNGLVVNAARPAIIKRRGLAKAFEEDISIRNLWDANLKEISMFTRVETMVFQRMIESGFLKLTGHTFALNRNTSTQRSRRLLALIKEHELYK